MFFAFGLIRYRLFHKFDHSIGRYALPGNNDVRQAQWRRSFSGDNVVFQSSRNRYVFFAEKTGFQQLFFPKLIIYQDSVRRRQAVILDMIIISVVGRADKSVLYLGNFHPTFFH
ncbi:hypothetical protein SDC9_175292 [bioreactor metagenome]|uniref:Uncharacterized protein n=1 Tax=bioreactor metagenome TaxID=1076179 RepID=A0A645GLR3_9ZZZZ